MKLIHRILMSNECLRLALVLLCSTAAPLSAATFTVTTTADNGNNSAPTSRSLREAIINSNSTPGANTIIFNFGSALPPFIIQPMTIELPPISNTVTIDGYFGGPGGAKPNSHAQGDNAMLTVVINGSNYTVGDGQFTGNGLHFVAGSDGSVVKGLVINEWLLNGILIDGSLGAINGINIVGNFIGTTVSGNVVDANRTGIGISGATNPATDTIIGTPANEDRNIIAGSFGYMIVDGYTIRGGCIASAGATGTLIQNNYIGTDTSGTVALGGSLVGVLFVSETNGTIGGPLANQGNIISGHSIFGVNLTNNFPVPRTAFPAGCTGCQVQGNYIGTNVTGTASLGNSNAGIALDAISTNNVIGGSVAGAGNLISGNGNGLIPGSGVGIRLGQNDMSLSTGNVIQGNYIGVDVSGTTALSNTGWGIIMNNPISTIMPPLINPQNTVGGSTPFERNIISGNEKGGVFVYGTNMAVVTGNYIGVDVSGTLAIPNGGNGVQLGTNGPSSCAALNTTIG